MNTRITSTSSSYGSMSSRHHDEESSGGKHTADLSLSENDEDDDSVDPKDSLLKAVQSFDLAYDKDRGYRATELKLSSFKRPHMRAFHASWICFLCSWLVWFAMAPLLSQIQASIPEVSMEDIWTSNMWSMVGTVGLRLVLGPLCDQYGAKDILTGLLALCALPLGLSAIFLQGPRSLFILRFWIGCVGGTLVPAQYWVTSHFVREVCGRTAALAAGWGALGGGVAQVFMGTLVYPGMLHLFHGNVELAWRWALVVPAALALGVAGWVQQNAEDMPLGNTKVVQRAGLAAERSAVDSFRSGIVNLNGWILFFSFAGSLGIELTMNSCATVHLADRLNVSLAQGAAYASLFGLMNIFSRGLGGYLSDRAYKAYSLWGRLALHCAFQLAEGIGIFVFAHAQSQGAILTSMMTFAILGQMSMGSCFALVPYVHPPSTGTIAGLVGAGGNVGAIFFLHIWKVYDQTPVVGLSVMAVYSLVVAVGLTPCMVMKGYRGLLFGKEQLRPAGGSMPLLVPTPGSVEPDFDDNASDEENSRQEEAETPLLSAQR